MISNTLIPVGTILKTKGFDGTLLVEFNYEIINDTFKVFFIKQNEIETPLLIQKSVLFQDTTFYIQFQTLETKEKAQKYNGAILYMPESIAQNHFIVEEDDDVIGYEVYNREHYLGRVIELYSNKMQETIEIEDLEGTRILIPFVDELLNEIDPETMKIVYDFPPDYLESIKL